MPEFMKNEFITNFNKIQHVYHILNKFKFLYKYKKSKIIVDCDLCLNKLDINHNLTFCLYQGNNRYLFNINEIVKIIITSLINSPLFFSEPLVSKNPYNNIPLNKSTLYNIYFTLQRKNIKIHELFYKFFLQNFNLTDFKKYNEHLIKIVKHLLVYFSEYSPNKDLKSIQIKDKLYSTYPNTNKFESLGLEEKVGVFQHVLWSVLSIDDIKEYFHSITPEGHKPYYVSKINCFVFSRNADTLKKPTTKYVQAKNMFN